MLSKDHFDNILNEPAGKVAQVVVEHTVNSVVAAWSDPSIDINQTLDEVWSCGQCRTMSQTDPVFIDHASVPPPILCEP